MPRFGIDSPSFSSPLGSYGNDSPTVSLKSPPIHMRRSTMGPPLHASVRLSCLSPDGRSMHSLVADEIHTHHFPLKQSERGQDGSSKLIRTPLPATVREALLIDQAMELLCVEGSTKMEKNQLPMLCLYSSKAIYLLRVEFTGTTGRLVELLEPFEPYLLDVSALTVLRVRAAPQQTSGYTMMCPTASVAVLTRNKDTLEYAVMLYHGRSKQVTSPLVFAMEELVEEGQDIVDFCFAKSTGLSLLSSTSVLLLRACGDVLAASPLVFDGALVTRLAFDEGINYLTARMEAMDEDSAAWRQARAAEIYFVDAFGGQGNPRSHFLTATVNSHSPKSLWWPLQVLGPVLYASSIEPGSLSATIESFGQEEVVGLAMGGHKGSVDFGILSPTALIPRFIYESDPYELDDAVSRLGALVERVSLGGEAWKSVTTTSLSLLSDPLSPNLLHCATASSVVTISTNAVHVASQHLAHRAVDVVRTTAWSCLVAAAQSKVTGVVVSGDDSTGHELVVRLQDGSMIEVNIDEMRFLREIDAMFGDSFSKDGPRVLLGRESSDNEALRTMEATQPFYEVVAPVIKKVQAGLVGMTKIVGSSTSYRDITAEQLAVAIDLKKRCDEEVVLPLLQLRKLVEKRQDTLTAMMESQKQQVRDLLETVERLKAGMDSIKERTEKAESNASLLAERSANALQASQDLQPTITQAELEFFRDIKRLDLKTSKLEKQTKELTKAIARPTLVEANGAVPTPVSLDAEEIAKANSMLDYQGQTLAKTRDRLEGAETLLDHVRATSLLKR